MGHPFDAATFLAELKRLHREGHRSYVLNVMFRKIDELLLRKEFEAVRDLLRLVSAADFDLRVLVGFLVLTRPFRSELSTVRAQLFDRIHEHAVSEIGAEPAEKALSVLR